jgi:hypothetical protein
MRTFYNRLVSDSALVAVPTCRMRRLRTPRRRTATGRFSSRLTLSQIFQTAEKWSRVASRSLTREGEAMKKSRYTEEQVAYALRLAESGTPVADVCRQTALPRPRFTFGRRSSAA